MSVRTTVGGTLVVIVAAGVLLNAKSWRERQPGQATRPGAARQRAVLLVATWEDASRGRKFQMSWTADGVKPPAVTTGASPWEKQVTATLGSTVTLTVKPLLGGSGEHTCRVEEPPGVPIPQPHAQMSGGGTTPIMCTAVIGA